MFAARSFQLRGGRVVPRLSMFLFAAMRCVHVVYVRREVTFSYQCLIFVFFSDPPSRWVKINPHFHVSDTCVSI